MATGAVDVDLLGQRERHDGSKIARFHPKVVPDDPAVLAAIEAGLPR